MQEKVSFLIRCKWIGAPGGIRTSNLLIRSQILYPVELRVHVLQVTLRRFSHQTKFDSKTTRARASSIAVARYSFKMLRILLR
jgi:hypothetical protein